LWLGLILDPGPGALAQKSQAELAEMSLEALMKVEVTSVSKKPHRLADSAAAIAVLTQDDIRRSGATTIPEALRLVPGLQVARIGSSTWVVNARGFSNRFSNKFLVLIDGRAVYTPVFSGVFWDVQDTALEDIERIEVIRGPGAALWGANAVNGVINIITRNARDTQGLLVSGGGGNEERGFGTVRFGQKLGEAGALRAFAKYTNRDDAALRPGPFPLLPLVQGGALLRSQPGGDAGDAWHVFRGGFRTDWNVSERDALTFLGEAYGGKVGERVPVPSLFSPFSAIDQADQDLSGANLLGRWQRSLSDVSSLMLQLYYDHTRRDDARALFDLDTFDIDTQYRIPLGSRHDFIGGLGYRLHRFGSRAGRLASFAPESRDVHLFSGFVHDDITLIEGALHLIAGSKLEHNSFTQFEFQPNARLLWTPAPEHTIWAAVSRAVRTPSIVERDGRLELAVIPPGAPGLPVPPPVPVLLQLFGTEVKSEELLALELGYRTRAVPRVSLDAAAFYNTYDSLQFAGLADPGGLPPLTFVPVLHIPLRNTFNNELKARTYGVELAADIELTSWWLVRLGYTFLQVRNRAKGESILGDPTIQDGTSPHHEGFLRSSMNLAKNVELDLVPRYVGKLGTIGVASYFELDARLAWRPAAWVELAIVGRNLVHSRHTEFRNIGAGPVPTALQRQAYAAVTLTF
jgi:iron complex outermembrane receptor protein